LGIEQGLPARASHFQQVLGEQGNLVEAAFEHILKALQVDLPELLALQGEGGCGQRCTQFVGHHAQQAFLRAEAVDQGFVLLAQHQELVFQLQLALGAAAIQFGGLQAEAKAAHHLILLPAGQPAAQLLKNAAARKHLFR